LNTKSKLGKMLIINAWESSDVTPNCHT